MEQFGFVLPKWGRCCPAIQKSWKTTPCKVGRDRHPRHSPHSILGSRLSAQLRPCAGSILAFSVVGACGVARLGRLRFVNEFYPCIYQSLRNVLSHQAKLRDSASPKSTTAEGAEAARTFASWVLRSISKARGCPALRRGVMCSTICVDILLAVDNNFVDTGWPDASSARSPHECEPPLIAAGVFST